MRKIITILALGTLLSVFGSTASASGEQPCEDGAPDYEPIYVLSPDLNQLQTAPLTVTMKVPEDVTRMTGSYNVGGYSGIQLTDFEKMSDGSSVGFDTWKAMLASPPEDGRLDLGIYGYAGVAESTVSALATCLFDIQKAVTASLVTIGRTVKLAVTPRRWVTSVLGVALERNRLGKPFRAVKRKQVSRSGVAPQTLRGSFGKKILRKKGCFKPRRRCRITSNATITALGIPVFTDQVRVKVRKPRRGKKVMQ